MLAGRGDMAARSAVKKTLRFEERLCRNIATEVGHQPRIAGPLLFKRGWALGFGHKHRRDLRRHQTGLLRRKQIDYDHSDCVGTDQRPARGFPGRNTVACQQPG